MNLESLKSAQKIGKSIGNKEISSELESIIKLVESHGNKPQIINSGLLKAGKSSLFNAIIGKEEFDTDVVRATVANKSIELEKYFLVDTPGLDANDADTKIALDGYNNADILIFVHNAIDGELNKIEFDAINTISNMFGNATNFLPSSVLVLSHADQLEKSELDKLISVIAEQCRNLFKAEFGYVVAVNSTGYIKGISENKNLLVEASNINTLKEFLDSLFSKDGYSSCFNTLVKKKVDEINREISTETDKIAKEKSQLSNLTIDTDQLVSTQNEMLKMKNNIINKLKNESTIPPTDISKPYFHSDERSYKEYKSEYEARTAAKNSCESAIKSAVAATKEKAFNIVAYYESFIAPDGKINTVKNELFNVYNEIKELYYKVVKSNTKPHSFGIVLKSDSTTDNLKKQVGYGYESAKYIAKETFRSVDHYLTSYSCNMDIDYDYRTEYVSGLFGNKEKEVKYFRWEIKGAVDDIGNSAKDILIERTTHVIKSCNELYGYYISDFITQFESMITFLCQNIDSQISISEVSNQKLSVEKKALDTRIMNLEQFKKSLERL